MPATGHTSPATNPIAVQVSKNKRQADGRRADVALRNASGIVEVQVEVQIEFV